MFRRRKADSATPRCSFCNKSQNEVHKLIAGPTVYICDTCVAVCVDILAADRRASADGSRTGAAVTDIADPPTYLPSDAWCSLCGNRATLETALVIENRTLVCDSCVSAIASTAAEAHKGQHSGE